MCFDFHFNWFCDSEKNEICADHVCTLETNEPVVIGLDKNNNNEQQRQQQKKTTICNLRLHSFQVLEYLIWCTMCTLHIQIAQTHIVVVQTTDYNMYVYNDCWYYYYFYYRIIWFSSSSVCYGTCSITSTKLQLFS